MTAVSSSVRRSRALAWFASLVLLGGPSVSDGAWPPHDGEYAYWSSMPTPEQVRAERRDDEPAARAARLHADFSMLLELVDIHRDGRGADVRADREKRLNKAYGEELEDVIREGHEANRLEIQQRSLALQADAAYADAFLARHFPPAALVEIEPLLVRMRAEAGRRAELRRSGLEAVQRVSSVPPFANAIDRIGGRPLFFVLTVVMPVLLLLALAREFMPHGLDRANATVGRRGFGHYVIARDTGVVIAAAGGGFSLRNQDGDERTLQADGVAPDLVAGQSLSLLWAVGAARDAEPQLLFRNHRTVRSWFDHAAIRRLVAPSWWPVALTGLVALVAGALAGDQLLAEDAEAAPRLAVPIAMALVGWAGALWLRRRAIRERVRLFEDDVTDRTVPELDRRAETRGRPPESPLRTGPR